MTDWTSPVCFYSNPSGINSDNRDSSRLLHVKLHLSCSMSANGIQDRPVTVTEPHKGGGAHEMTARGSSLSLPRFMRLKFTPESLEKVYQTYFLRQRQETLLVLIVFAALFNSYVIIMCAVVYSQDKLNTLAVAAAGLGSDILLYIMSRFRFLPEAVSQSLMPYVLWLLITVHVLCYFSLNFAGFYAAGDTVGWQIFFIFSFFLTLPLPLAPIALLSALSCCAHTLLLGFTVAQRHQDKLQLTVLIRQVTQTHLHWKTCFVRFHSQILQSSLLQMPGTKTFLEWWYISWIWMDFLVPLYHQSTLIVKMNTIFRYHGITCFLDMVP